LTTVAEEAASSTFVNYQSKTRWWLTHDSGHRDMQMSLSDAKQLQRWHQSEESIDLDDTPRLNDAIGFEASLLAHLRLRAPPRGIQCLNSNPVWPPSSSSSQSSGTDTTTTRTNQDGNAAVAVVASVPTKDSHQNESKSGGEISLTILSSSWQLPNATKVSNSSSLFVSTAVTITPRLNEATTAASSSSSSRARRLLLLICSPSGLSSLVTPFDYSSLESLIEPPKLDQDKAKDSPISIHRAIQDADIDLHFPPPISSLLSPTPRSDEEKGSVDDDLCDDMNECHRCGQHRSRQWSPPPSYLTPLLGLRNGLPISDQTRVWGESSSRHSIPNQPKSATIIALEELIKPSPLPPSSLPSTPSGCSDDQVPSLNRFMDAVLPPVWPLPASMCGPNQQQSSVNDASSSSSSSCHCEWHDIYSGAPLGTFGHGIFHAPHEYATKRNFHGDFTRRFSLGITPHSEVIMFVLPSSSFHSCINSYYAIVTMDRCTSMFRVTNY
jgi:hypothetical protein